MLKFNWFAIVLALSISFSSSFAFGAWKYSYCNDALTYRTSQEALSKAFIKKMNATKNGAKIEGIAVIPFDRISRPQFALVEFIKEYRERTPFGLDVVAAKAYLPKGADSGIGFLLVSFKSTKTQIVSSVNLHPIVRHEAMGLGPYQYSIESIETGSFKSVENKLAKKFAEVNEASSADVGLDADAASDGHDGFSLRPGRGERAWRESPKRYGQPPLDGSTGGVRDWDRLDDTFADDSIDSIGDTSNRNPKF